MYKRQVKPLDESLILSLAQKHKLLVTLEENVVAGGAGSAVNEILNKNLLTCEILNIGIPDHFPSIGTPSDQKIEAGLDKERILKIIDKKLNS